MSYHVIITRVTDSSARHAMGHRSQVGRVTRSRNFSSEKDAERERDAWSHAGEYAHYGQSDWTAEVRHGPAPDAPCGIKVCTVLTEHKHH
jgi:hypothetical protein